MRTHNRFKIAAFVFALLTLGGFDTRCVSGEQATAPDAAVGNLLWDALPDHPNELGVAGPFVGTSNNALIVAGGANFPRPVWDNEKVWQNSVDVLLRRTNDFEKPNNYEWVSGGTLPRRCGYGASVSAHGGVLCMGGNDGVNTFDDVFLIRWNATSETVETIPYPALPEPCAYGQATLVDGVVYFAGGQDMTGEALKNFWALDLNETIPPQQAKWQTLDPWPGPSRAFNLTTHQHNGYEECVYVISGRNESRGKLQLLTDVWEYRPSTAQWRQRSDAPRPVMGAAAIGIGQSHVLVLGGDDGTLFGKADELKDTHPGFPKEALRYHTITDTWTSAGAIPQNQVTTNAVMWEGRIVLPTGEVRPRVRTPAVWSISPSESRSGFSTLDYVVLFGYLLTMVGVGLYFAKRNRNTDDYFRGGSQMPWWAVGCSIFATMLSSVTFTGIPSKAFAQDWVYAVGNLMIPVIAFVGVYVALPFYRRVDVTSAYEYLEKRFSRSVRLFGSASFTLFHIFRMAVVMSLTGLALAVATPLSPAESVMLMGLLSVLYSTMGGIEAVVWTDTIQTFVLLGGALLALVLMVLGADGGWNGMLENAFAYDKLRVANFHTDIAHSQLALWVVILGAAGQNLSSYTADQAVVQRYMATPDQNLAAKSIWTNAFMAIPATLLFFGVGTALFGFYRTHPERLDPNITTDQIFPLFIANEMPIGIAGLIVAGIFSAAQSTVSTSMNSTSTTIITDFLRPMSVCQTERGYLRAARLVTFVVGILGTLLGVTFVDPSIQSLFDSSIMVIGMFMGVLGGLFVLGFTTRRASSSGAMIGALSGTALLIYLWQFSEITGYLYTVIGIATCFTTGYLSSILLGAETRELRGLTLFTTPASSATVATGDDMRATEQQPC
ncbi:sodium:solute symporter family transporter [Rhodopirellula sallentina]|uniref:Sodium/solute symporter family protein n=1 Tax=Rhodopirellula sallentina SM41 TaxID=1263870 RepID=M5U9I2_9BACT|nr:sodium/solute symporter [Rhodopirellula sallentina]EMI52648.1 sodium/solute symporter family protein [Rhodopirellula sallentina SM41]